MPTIRTRTAKPKAKVNAKPKAKRPPRPRPARPLSADETAPVEAAFRELAAAVADNYPGRPAMVSHMLRKALCRSGDDNGRYKTYEESLAAIPAPDARHGRQRAAMSEAFDALAEALGNGGRDRDPLVYAFAEGLIAELEAPPRPAPEPEPEAEPDPPWPTATEILPEERSELAVAIANLERVLASCLARDPRSFARYLVQDAHWEAVEGHSAEHAAIRRRGVFNRIRAAREDVYWAVAGAVGWCDSASAEAPGGRVHGSKAHDRDVTQFVLECVGLPASYIVKPRHGDPG